MCGEKIGVGFRGGETLGSPPHVRGKESQLLRGQYPRGITPACAGKRGAVYASILKTGDHPRMCGEKNNG